MLYLDPPETGGMKVREDERGGLLVELSGEFDLRNLASLRGFLEDIAELGPPVVVDLSRVSFLDLGSARELAVCSHLHAGRVALRAPSAQVLVSLDAFGLRDWVSFAPSPAPDALRP